MTIMCVYNFNGKPWKQNYIFMGLTEILKLVTKTTQVNQNTF